MPRRIKAVLKAKEGQTQCYYGIPNNPLAECTVCAFYIHLSFLTGMIHSEAKA